MPTSAEDSPFVTFLRAFRAPVAMTLMLHESLLRAIHMGYRLIAQPDQTHFREWQTCMV